MFLKGTYMKLILCSIATIIVSAYGIPVVIINNSDASAEYKHIGRLGEITAVKGVICPGNQITLEFEPTKETLKINNQIIPFTVVSEWSNRQPTIKIISKDRFEYVYAKNS